MNNFKKVALWLTGAATIGTWIYYYNSNEKQWNFQWDHLCKYDKYKTYVKDKVSEISTNNFKISDKWLIKYELANSLSDWQLTIFFRTNSDTLYQNDFKDIENFLKNVDKNTEILLEWYSDSRWNEQDNSKLSEKRILQIRKLLKTKGYKKIKLINYWENNTTNQAESTRWLTLAEKLKLRKDRKVDIKIKTNAIESWLNKFPADKYLIDFSGSMKWSKEQKVKEYEFKEWSEVYWFNDEMNQDNCTIDLENQISNWGTPLWDSLYTIINKSEKNKIITILTDWEDTNSNKNINEIINLANSKWITLNFISIWNFDEDLKKISKKTKWWFYFINN